MQDEVLQKPHVHVTGGANLKCCNNAIVEGHLNGIKIMVE